MFFGVVAFGLLVGCVTGLIGAGGAIIAVPALIYVVGVPVETAISTSLVMGGITPVAAVFPRLGQGLVDWRTVGAVALTGVPTAFVGTLVGAALPDQITLLAFAALMIIAGLRMLRGRPDRVKPAPRPRMWVVRALGVGLLVGFLTGLLGVGGGFIIVPALVFALDLPIAIAIASSLAITVINSVAGIIAHLGATRPDWPIAIAFAVPAAIASLVSARSAGRISNRMLQTSFAVLVLVIAVITVLPVVLTTR